MQLRKVQAAPWLSDIVHFMQLGLIFFVLLRVTALKCKCINVWFDIFTLIEK